MDIINVVCEKISNNIANELELDNEKKSVVNYGIFAFIQMSISIIFVFIFGIIFNVATEALIITFTISILRKSSGGVHASTPSICTIIGTIVGVGFALLIKLIEFNLIFVIILGLVVFIWSYITINKLVPVDSLAKPIKSEAKRSRLKNKSLRILMIYGIIVILNITIYSYINKYYLLIYSLCIYIGLAWQVFSLTDIGNTVLSKIDSYLSLILFKRR